MAPSKICVHNEIDLIELKPCRWRDPRTYISVILVSMIVSLLLVFIGCKNDNVGRGFLLLRHGVVDFSFEMI